MADRGRKGRKTFIYSTQNTNYRRDAVYENPRLFEKLPPQGLKQYDEVIVVGNWPVVEAALDAAGIKWHHGDKDDDRSIDGNYKSNTGSVRGAATGSSQGGTLRQKEGAVPIDLAKTGGLNEGEGDPSIASVQTTGDGEETVAREQGVKTEDIMSGTQQVELAPGQPHPPLADGGKPEQRSLEEVREGTSGSGTSDNTTQVEIPDNWEELDWPEQKALASNFTSDAVTSKAIAAKTIKAELARRG